MKYDFTSIMDRHGMDAIAVDRPCGGQPAEGFDLIPMWIADMNFPTVPTIPQAIHARTGHAAYGYFRPRQEYYDAILRWHREHHGNTCLAPEHIGYANGVLGGVVAALNVLCSRGDNVLVHSPTYVGFTHTLENNGYNIIHSPLVIDGDGIWRMDFADMEEKLVEQIALREALSTLPQRERTVIDLRYYRGLTQDKTAKILGVSQVQISRIEKKAIVLLRERIL